MWVAAAAAVVVGGSDILVFIHWNTASDTSFEGKVWRRWWSSFFLEVKSSSLALLYKFFNVSSSVSRDYREFFLKYIYVCTLFIF